MNSLLNDYAAGVLRTPEPPCLSLYQPTHRHHPDNQQDPIRFRNLVKALEESLRQKYSTRDVRPLLEPLQNLAEDHSFWNHTLDGLALLTAPGVFRVYRLQRPVAELAVVANSFHIKPLIRILQSADRYHVLGLSRQEIKLLEGNRDTLDEVELFPAVPRTVTEVVGEDSKEAHLSVWSPSPGIGVRLAGLVEMFGVARSKELGADDLAQIAASAVAGRVGTLLIEADRHIPGRIDVGTGRIEFDDLADPEVDDVLDDVGELVLKNRGQIVIVPAERMPTQTGIAAIYRF